MEITPRQTIEGLNHLITIAVDGQHGYSLAAEHATNPLLKALFLKHAAERAGFATELKTLVREAGENPDKEGGPVAALHRAWIDIKTAVTSNDNKAVLNECITGDRAAVAAYESELKDNVYTAEQRGVLERQLKLVREALFNVEQEAAKQL